MRVLLTGGTGYLGLHLVQHLTTLGWEVCLLTRRTVDIPYPVVVFDGNVHQLAHQMEKLQVDVVVHMASLFLVDHQPNDIDELVQSNIILGLKVLEAMAIAQVRSFVNTGTAWQNHFNESYHPVNLYAATKQAFEDLLRYYHETRSIQALTVRLFDTYGPDDPRKKLFNLLNGAYHSGTMLDMSLGEQQIDLVHVDDVVLGFEAAIRHLTNGDSHRCEVYALSSGQPQSLRNVVEMYQELLGRPLAHFGARPYRAREVMEPWSQGVHVPGWSPRVTLEMGLQQLADHQKRIVR